MGGGINLSSSTLTIHNGEISNNVAMSEMSEQTQFQQDYKSGIDIVKEIEKEELAENIKTCAYVNEEEQVVLE